MNAEQYKKTNNIGFYISIIIIIIGSVMAFFEAAPDTSLQGLAAIIIGALVSLVIVIIGNFVFTTRKVGAILILVGGTISCVVSFLISRNNFYTSLMIALIAYSIAYLDISLSRILIVLDIDFFAITIITAILKTSLNSSYIAPFLTIATSSFACIFAVNLLVRFRDERVEQRVKELTAPPAPLDESENPASEDDEGANADENSAEYSADEEADGDEYDVIEESVPESEVTQSEEAPAQQDDAFTESDSGTTSDSSSENESMPESIYIPKQTAEPESSEDEKHELLTSMFEKSYMDFCDIKEQILNIYKDFENYEELAKNRTAAKDTDTHQSALNDMVSEIESISERSGEHAQSAQKAIEELERLKLLLEAPAPIPENTGIPKEEAVFDRDGIITESFVALENYSAIFTDLSKKAELLSLTASIESAKAGAAGKGFASVASDIRSFGASAGTASKDLHEHVSALKESIDTAVEQLKKEEEKPIEPPKAPELSPEEKESLRTITLLITNLEAEISSSITGYDTLRDNLNTLSSELSAENNKDNDDDADAIEKLEAIMTRYNELLEELEEHRQLLSDITKQL